MLKKFAATEVPRLRVVLRPGPGGSIEIDGMKRPIGWRIDIVGGIAKGAIAEWKIEKVRTLDPTLTIYVTNLVDLDKLELPSDPEKIDVLQLSDLRKRYQSGLEEKESERVKKEAAQCIGELDKDAARDGDPEQVRLFRARAEAIAKFIEKRELE